MTRLGHHYGGWRPDLPDHRDHLAAIPFFGALPASADLTADFPAVYDQGDLGSCTANAAAGALQFLQHKQALPLVMPSRLFTYYHARLLEGTEDYDSGATIRDTMKVCAQFGTPPETDWPYDIGQFAQAPPQQATTDALARQLLKYARVPQSTRALKAVLASGYPIEIGFTVYASMESEAVAQTGDVPMPGWGEDVLGGHAVLLVGYNDAPQRFTFRNSWGPGWGRSGYGTLPYAYLADSGLAQDFWVARVLES